LSTDPQLTLYFSPFAIDFTAGIRVLNVRVADTRVYIDKNRFSTSISYNYLIVHGSVSFSAGTHNGKSYIAGSGRNSIGIKKGTIGRICIGICVKLPPANLNLGSIGIDFGTFRNDKFGIKGTLKVWKWRGSVFVGFNGGIKFGKLRDYQLIGAQRVQQARATYTAMQALAAQGLAAQLPLDSDLSFAPNGDTLVRVVIPTLDGASAASPGGELAAGSPEFTAGLAPLFPTDVISTVSVLRSDVIFALAQPPDGKLEFTLFNPHGTALTPDMLPSYAEYVQVVSDEDIQSMYFIANATSGEWRVRISGDTDNTDFTFAVLGNTPPPFALVALQATGPTTATVGWLAQVAVTETNVVNFYAHSGPLTRTVTYTGSQGAPYTVVEEVFEGVRVAEGLPATTGTQGYAHTLDLSALPSGVYALWMEVDDDENPRLRQYILTGITSGPPVTVTVDHSATFPDTWAATVAAGLGIAEGDMQIGWIANAHPDAPIYTLHLTTTHPLTPTLSETRVFTTSDVVYNSVEIVRIDNVLPGQLYTFRIGAHHRQDGRVVWSRTFGFTTPQPEFILAAPTTPITAPAGQTAAAVLTLYIADDLPFPVALAPGYIAAPDGFTLSFTPEVMTTTGMVTATVQIEAVSRMYTGTYAVPVIAQSGALVRGAVVAVTVVEAQSIRFTLPLVLR
jgi:hypothetical protein